VALGAIIVVGAVVGLGRSLTRNWTEVRIELADADWQWLAAGTVAAAVAVLLVAHRWHRTLTVLGASVDWTDTTRWFMTGQMAKYAPGGFWHVVGQGELASRGGVPRRTAYASVLLSTATMVGGAAVLVALGALLPEHSRTPWWAVVAGVALSLVFLEPHLRHLLLTRAGAAAPVPARSLIGLALGSVPMWLVVGASTWLVARAFDPDVTLGRVVVAAVASWLVGIVTLPAPGGIGVREAVLVAALRDDVGSGTAALIAITARLAFVVADVAWLAAASLRRASQEPISEPSP
jgi:uncharacterized membrane protein YbhN (UPF0104 family)